jgi:hypothetical protein
MKSMFREITLLKLSNRLKEAFTTLKQGLLKDRGDIPGWVLVTVMTAGLVVAVWSVADDQLKTVLTNALRGVSQP